MKINTKMAVLLLAGLGLAACSKKPPSAVLKACMQDAVGVDFKDAKEGHGSVSVKEVKRENIEMLGTKLLGITYEGVVSGEPSKDMYCNKDVAKSAKCFGAEDFDKTQEKKRADILASLGKKVPNCPPNAFFMFGGCPMVEMTQDKVNERLAKHDKEVAEALATRVRVKAGQETPEYKVNSVVVGNLNADPVDWKCNN